MSVAGVVAVLAAAPGTAGAAGKGTALSAHDNGDCTVTITLTNYTNTTYYQPDWWFDQEGPPPANGSDPADFVSPWREVPSTGTNWPFARWIGDPPLHSEVADGVAKWPGSPYNSSAQPDGYESSATIDPREAENPAPPAVADDGSYTIWFRINNGPQTADRVPPASVKVTGCESSGGSSDGSSGGSSGSTGGSLDFGSLDFGSIFKPFS
ncbi:hypothetical protein SCNU_05990 [Gordonia neofelifaecis NRRL B-59395]|uniref:Secreted protein n=1 Tax=Gordonia neofelifaecis NRRL B-59395 TaxID=644548 RepID=F1YHD0_9ACTN|nr:hypothetical protein SCNU_05990 [Gordonia neofelifaecis NRRL B-59395]